MQKRIRIEGILAIVLAAVFACLLVWNHTSGQILRRHLADARRDLLEEDYDDAIEDYLDAISVDDQYTDAHLGLADAYARRAESLDEKDEIDEILSAYDHAIEEYQTAIRQNRSRNSGQDRKELVPYKKLIAVCYNAADTADKTDTSKAEKYRKTALQIAQDASEIDPSDREIQDIIRTETGQSVPDQDSQNADRAGNTQNTADTSEPSEAAPEQNAETTECPYRLYYEQKLDTDRADDGTPLTKNSYALLHCADNDSQTDFSCDGINQALDLINADTDQMAASFASDSNADAEQQYNSLDDKQYFMPSTEENFVGVERADAQVLSVLRKNITMYGGAAHPFSFSCGYTFDAKTGNQLTITDVLNISDTGDLASILADKLLQEYDPALFSVSAEELPAEIKRLMDGDEYYTGQSDLHYVTWYMDSQGVTFLFDEYVLGSYASGQFSVAITSGENPDLFKTEYVNSQEDAFQAALPEVPYKVDGEELNLYYGINNSQDGDDIGDIMITLGDKELDIPNIGWDISAYLVTVRSGKYLLINAHEDSGWQALYYVDLSASELTDEMMDSGIGYEIPLNPGNFNLYRYQTLMSCYMGVRSYHIGQGGAPEPNEAYYRVLHNFDMTPSGNNENSLTLTLKKDSDFSVLDSPDQDTTHTESFPQGTQVTLYRTDGESIVDGLTDDGKYIRFSVSDEWPEIVDGREELENLFDGTFFAN